MSDLAAGPAAELIAVLAVGAAAYAVRIGGFFLTAWLRLGPTGERILRQMPGNLFAAFAAITVVQGGVIPAAGCAAAIVAMILVRREWAAWGAGALGAGLATWLLGAPV